MLSFQMVTTVRTDAIFLSAELLAWAIGSSYEATLTTGDFVIFEIDLPPWSIA
jgi:hypothetical protein